MKFLRYVAVDDCGRIISPLLVEGQVHGGIAQGSGRHYTRKSCMTKAAIIDRDPDGLRSTTCRYAAPL